MASSAYQLIYEIAELIQYTAVHLGIEFILGK